MKGLIFVVVLFLSIQASAWEGTDLTVKFIDVKSSGNVTVYFTNPSGVGNPAGCSQYGMISWEGGNPSASNFLSTMLAAHMSNKTVQLQVDTEVCLWGGWPRLLTVRIK